MAEMMYAQVLVDRSMGREEQPFDYRIPQGMALCVGSRVTVPLGSTRVEGVVLSTSETTQVPAGKVRSIVSLLPDSLTQEQVALSEWMRIQCYCTRAEALRLMVPASLRRGSVAQKQVRQIRALPGDTAQMARAPKLQQAYEKLAAAGGWTLAAPFCASVSGGVEKVRRLIAMGLAQERMAETLRSPYEDMQPQTEAPPELTADQQRVLEPVLQALETGAGRFLIHGITGSGKTEVYFRAVERVLEKGQTALILVPEIALTPQMVSRFRRRFGLQAAVLHSRLSDGERYDEWRRIRRGDARVVIGARSAVFAPVDTPALIVIDEEHEASYQSDTQVRYDAVSVAAWRCAAGDGVLLLGSATPSVVRYHQTLEGEYTLLEMPNRANGAPLPPVEVVDMRRELEKGNRSMLSVPLYQELSRVLENGEQAILLLNRRGYASFVSCRSCGEAIRCPHCDVSLTYHQAEGALVCHYCGHRQPMPQTCPACGSRYIKQFGVGTQKLEEEVKRFFPSVKVLRMDMDTTRGKEGHRRIIQAFENGEAQVLVCTQMVAKGLDFPNVTLVGVVAADLTLFLPDYRGAERTFQLLTQVAGRAGRGQKGGRVVVQTYAPEHYAVTSASRHDYRAFFLRERQARKNSGFPPFGTLVACMISHPREEEAKKLAQTLYEALCRALDGHPRQRILFQNYGPAVYRRIKDEFRYQTVFRLEGDESACAPALADMVKAAKQVGTAGALIEINPSGLL